LFEGLINVVFGGGGGGGGVIVRGYIVGKRFDGGGGCDFIGEKIIVNIGEKVG
jgi:hypothetical protein